MVGVDQGLVQVQHQHLLPDHVEAVSGDGGKGRDVILDGFMLLNLRGVKGFVNAIPIQNHRDSPL